MAGALSPARLSWQIFEDFTAQRADWAEEAANDEDFYIGKQWTAEEIKKIKEKGMAPLVVNRVMPVIQQEISIFLAKRPGFRYFPMEDGDPAVAQLFNTVSDYIWHISNGDQHAITVTKDYFVVGVGYMQAYIDRFSDNGRGDVKWRSLAPYDVYADPNSREPDLSDARYILISRVVDKATLRFIYPDRAGKINKTASIEGPVMDRPAGNPIGNEGAIAVSDYEYTPSFNDDGKVRLVERHELIRVKMIKVFDLLNGTTHIMDPKKFDPEGIKGIKTQDIWQTKEKITITVGEDTLLYQYTLPVDSYTIIPAMLHHQRNPYPRGDVAITKGMQQETNKRRSILIHNATLSGNYRIMAEKGSIANKEEFERKGSQPGFILEYLNQGGQPPKEMLPQQLPAAWIQLEQLAKSDMEYSVSVFSHQMGSAQDAPDTYRGLLAMEENGQRKIMAKAKNLNIAFRNLGRVMVRLAQMVYRGPKMIRIVGEGSVEMTELVINQVEVDEQGVISRANDITVGSYDLVVLDGTSMPTNKMALLQLYMELFQLGIVDKQEVLKKTDVLDRERILERMGEVQQMIAQMQQMEETVKDTDGLNQTLRRQLTQANVQLETVKGAQQVKDEVLQTKSHQRLNRERMSDSLKIIKESARIKQEANENKVDAFLAHQKVELEKAKLQAMKSNKEAK